MFSIKFSDILPSNEIFSRDSLFLDEAEAPQRGENDDQPCDEDDDDEDDIIILHIDIREPIKRLKKLLEQKIAVNLTKYEFWLQDAQIVRMDIGWKGQEILIVFPLQLEPDKNLVDQCVKGEGLVQINVQVRTASKRINIVDVLKPTDEVLGIERKSNNEFQLTNGEYFYSGSSWWTESDSGKQRAIKSRTVGSV